MRTISSSARFVSVDSSASQSFFRLSRTNTNLAATLGPGQAIDDASLGLAFEYLVNGVCAERQFTVERNAAEEVLSDKGQCGNGFCQRANTMPVMFTHPASIHEGSDFKTVKEVIDFALNIDLGL